MSTPLPLVKMFPASASALSDVRKFVLARAEGPRSRTTWPTTS
jgi:hypothetical protein